TGSTRLHLVNLPPRAQFKLTAPRTLHFQKVLIPEKKRAVDEGTRRILKHHFNSGPRVSRRRAILETSDGGTGCGSGVGFDKVYNSEQVVKRLLQLVNLLDQQVLARIPQPILIGGDVPLPGMERAKFENTSTFSLDDESAIAEQHVQVVPRPQPRVALVHEVPAVGLNQRPFFYEPTIGADFI